MRSLSTRFFATGAIFALLGMIWGVQMSATHNHTLSPAHGHLNLIGFVGMSVSGAYYALSAQAAASPLARLHYWLTVLTVVVLTPGIALAILGVTETLAQVGSLIAIAAMGLFAYVVVKFGVSASANPAQVSQSVRPAE